MKLINELRIDNWVKLNVAGGEWVERQIKPHEFLAAYKNPDWLKPIELTEEWLDKADGCKCDGEWQYKVPIGAIYLYLRKSYNEWYSQFNDIYLGGHIQYVHTLQNFKFALTGTELTFKL